MKVKILDRGWWRSSLHLNTQFQVDLPHIHDEIEGSVEGHQHTPQNGEIAEVVCEWLLETREDVLIYVLRFDDGLLATIDVSATEPLVLKGRNKL